MLILALDAATRFSGVALCEDEIILGEYLVQSKLTHSQRLLPTIDALLADVQLKISNVEAIVISKGPGSFTGLRIGMALAKGLAQALGVPLVGIGSLEHWAASCATVAPGDLILPLLDAQRGEFYTALYRQSDIGLEQLLSPEPRSVASLLSDLEAYRNEAIALTGDVFPRHSADLSASFAGWRYAFSEHLAVPRPSALAQLGLSRLRKGQSDDLYTLAPEYLRLSEAERQRLARLQNEKGE